VAALEFREELLNFSVIVLQQSMTFGIGSFLLPQNKHLFVAATTRSGAGAKTDRHPVRSGQQVDGRNRNENPVAGRGTRAGHPAQNLPKPNGI
jgi:hypothetical protein